MSPARRGLPSALSALAALALAGCGGGAATIADAQECLMDNGYVVGLTDSEADDGRSGELIVRLDSGNRAVAVYYDSEDEAANAEQVQEQLVSSTGGQVGRTDEVVYSVLRAGDEDVFDQLQACVS